MNICKLSLLCYLVACLIQGTFALAAPLPDRLADRANILSDKYSISTSTDITSYNKQATTYLLSNENRSLKASGINLSVSDHYMLLFLVLVLIAFGWFLYRNKHLINKIHLLAENNQRLHLQLKLATESGRFGQWQWYVKKNRFHGDFLTHQIIGAQPGASENFRSVWKSSVHPNDITRVETELNLALSDDKAFDSEFRIIKPDNQLVTVRCRAVRLDNSTHEELILSGVIWDISELKKLEKENQKLATQDLLTNAKNRKGFMPLAQAEFDKAKRYHTSFAILRFRINDFHSINENFGHSMGELALSSFANTCISELRGSDLLCRLDADDFVALLHDNHLNNARLVAERLENAIEQLQITSCGISFDFSISIGLAEFLPSDSSLDETLHRAKQSLDNHQAIASSG